MTWGFIHKIFSDDPAELTVLYFTIFLPHLHNAKTWSISLFPQQVIHIY